MGHDDACAGPDRHPGPWRAGSRAVLGYLSPGTYAEGVVGARAFLAERQLYNGDERAEFGSG